MKLFATALLASASLAAGAATAQDTIAQSGSDWFKMGQQTLAENLAKQPNTHRAKNVILFTADGNGVGTNYAIRLFSGQKKGMLGSEYVQPQEAFPHLALVKTYTTNGQTPDSAPTASAMNTGVKSKNTMINVDSSVAVNDCANMSGHELTTFSEIVSGEGKSVGVISTARLTHATPAGVYAKTVNRNWEDNSKLPEDCTAQKDIAAQLIDAMKAGTVDVAFGGGRRHFLPKEITDGEGKTGKRTDGRNLVEEVKAMGGQFAWDDATFAALKDGDGPVLGLFEASHMKYEHDRTGEPSLAEMTAAAIKRLSGNENGFYLSIEAGRVDHANHDGNAHRTLTDGVAFADAIALADELTNDEDTLIIVTADHEHAIAFNGYCGRGSPITGLCYDIDDAGEKHLDTPLLAKDGKPYTVIGYLNGTGSVLTEQDDKSFSGTRPDVTNEQAVDADYIQQALIPMSSETHSGEDVAVYAKGPWSHLFDGTVEQNYIFHVMNHAINAE
ncbi:alkaline phosphatase [Breoghania sp. L-A4]|uniref:alkaline phosphatase n=1 Tax=Breoghania sp. L-A4 TaxID=2304600 RepID=UPI000E35CC98|nr:alkaline phosphatase [Breoghania sp. L-A4]AXS42601.1 alkaline phosphatase [Breoghania sp. L-A4]